MIGYIILGGIAAFAVYKSHQYHEELLEVQDFQIDMAVRYGTLQYHCHELANSELELSEEVTRELDPDYADGYKMAFENMQDALTIILEQDKKRNEEALKCLLNTQ